MLAAVAGKHALEIVQEFGGAQLQKVLGVALGLRLLILIVERRANRMMGVMDLLDKVRDRELQLMRPQAAGLIGGRPAVMGAEIHEDVGGLADYQVASLEKRRGEWR